MASLRMLELMVKSKTGNYTEWNRVIRVTILAAITGTFSSYRCGTKAAITVLSDEIRKVSFAKPR